MVLAENVMGKKEQVKGWAEIDENGKLVMGDIGLKVYRKRMDIRNEGFASEEVTEVEVKICQKKKK